jgi:serine/threonine protein kinase
MNLRESVRHHCPDVDPALVDMHFRRLPESYFERCAPAEVAHQLRMLARLSGPYPVEVEFRALSVHTFDVLVVGEDYTGTTACILAALAAEGFSLEDLHVAAYLQVELAGDVAPEPTYFIVQLRVSGSLRGRTAIEVAEGLRERLQAAFVHLAQSNLPEAQATAASLRSTTLRSTPHQSPPSTTGIEYEGVILSGDYRLQRRLEVGGMSEVYVATQLSLNRTVAVKLIRHEGPADDDLLARFSQERLVLAQLCSPYIVPIFAAGTMTRPGGEKLSWMAMEYMAGGDLARWLKRKGSPPVDLGVRWLRQALEGLHFAHQRHILHRDLKPHNLLLSIDGNLKVSDFGLLKKSDSVTGALTPRAGIVGTPLYMSPEQAQGEAVDERSDIFALGITFFYVFSGRLPFVGDEPQAVMIKIARDDTPSLGEIASQMPRPLVILIDRMLARQREERYQEVGVVLEDLASYERRGLLKYPDSGFYIPVTPAPLSSEELTHDYQLPREAPDDVVI